MLYRNALQVKDVKAPLKTDIMALVFPDAGPVQVLDERGILEALRKNQKWAAIKLSEDLLKIALAELIAEGKLLPVNPPAVSAPAPIAKEVAP